MGKVKAMAMEIVDRRTQVLILSGMEPEAAAKLAEETVYGTADNDEPLQKVEKPIK